MVAWSSIFSNNVSKGYQAYQAHSLFRCSAYKWLPVARKCIPIRRHGNEPRTLIIRETEYTWASIKNLLSIYIMIGLIPTIFSVLYANFFVGPPVLALIPEDYEPKHWEYYRHPVSRFLARYFIRSPQEKHERNLHIIYNTKKNQMLKKVRENVNFTIDEKQDYQAWYFSKPMTKYIRQEKELKEDYYEKYKGKTMNSVDI